MMGAGNVGSFVKNSVTCRRLTPMMSAMACVSTMSGLLMFSCFYFVGDAASAGGRWGVTLTLPARLNVLQVMVIGMCRAASAVAEHRRGSLGLMASPLRAMKGDFANLHCPVTDADSSNVNC
jgi:hypothetical protein